MVRQPSIEEIKESLTEEVVRLEAESRRICEAVFQTEDGYSSRNLEIAAHLVKCAERKSARRVQQDLDAGGLEVVLHPLFRRVAAPSASRLGFVLGSVEDDEG